MPRPSILAVVTALAVSASAAVTLNPTASVAAGPTVHVLHGHRPQVNAVFPSNRFTVADHRQMTGRRVEMPLPKHCTVKNSSICSSTRLLNTLDGFDLQP